MGAHRTTPHGPFLYAVVALSCYSLRGLSE